MTDVAGLYRRFGVKLRAFNDDGWVTCRCFTGRHEDRHPSARVHLRSGGYKCFTCGARGGILDALQQLGVYDREEARQLAVDYGILDAPKQPKPARPPPKNPATYSAPIQTEKPGSPEKVRYVDWDNATAGAQVMHDRTWEYVDDHGAPVGRVRRLDLNDGTKRIWQERPDGDSWAAGLEGAVLPLYRLPEVLEHAAAGRRIVVVEGEKAVDALDRLGHFATTNAGGAGKWRPQHTQALTGATAIVICDADGPGRQHALQVSLELVDHGVRTLTPYDPAPLRRDGYDIVDQLAQIAHNARTVNPKLSADELRGRLHDHLRRQIGQQLVADDTTLQRWHEHADWLTNRTGRALLKCERCREQRVHRTSHGIAFCPCGHHQPAPNTHGN